MVREEGRRLDADPSRRVHRGFFAGRLAADRLFGTSDGLLVVTDLVQLAVGIFQRGCRCCVIFVKMGIWPGDGRLVVLLAVLSNRINSWCSLDASCRKYPSASTFPRPGPWPAAYVSASSTGGSTRPDPGLLSYTAARSKPVPLLIRRRFPATFVVDSRPLVC